MRQLWRDILSFGPRPVGSKAHEEVLDYLFRRMKEIQGEAYLDEFTFEGWSHKRGELRMTEPEDRRLETFLFLGSGPGKVRGTVKRLGKNYVWNMYGWELYGVFSEDGRITAYLSGRNEGGPLSQTLVEGNLSIPHFIIGEQDNRLLLELLAKGRKVSVEGRAECTPVSGMKGWNIVAPFRNGASGEPMILLCAHYDSMYNTPGAYDNGAGAAVVMDLARELRDRPLDKNIVLVLTDAEECRLEGSRHFAEGVCREEIRYVLNIDGIGRGEELEIWCGREPFCRRTAEWISAYPGISEKTVKWPPPPGSDHAPFYEKGIDVCMFTFNDQDIIHTDRDVYQESMLANMEKMKRLALDFLREF